MSKKEEKGLETKQRESRIRKEKLIGCRVMRIGAEKVHHLISALKFKKNKRLL